MMGLGRPGEGGPSAELASVVPGTLVYIYSHIICLIISSPCPVFWLRGEAAKAHEKAPHVLSWGEDPPKKLELAAAQRGAVLRPHKGQRGPSNGWTSRHSTRMFFEQSQNVHSREGTTVVQEAREGGQSLQQKRRVGMDTRTHGLPSSKSSECEREGRARPGIAPGRAAGPCGLPADRLRAASSFLCFEMLLPSSQSAGGPGKAEQGPCLSLPSSLKCYRRTAPAALARGLCARRGHPV